MKTSIDCAAFHIRTNVREIAFPRGPHSRAHVAALRWKFEPLALVRCAASSLTRYASARISSDTIRAFLRSEWGMRLKREGGFNSFIEVLLRMVGGRIAGIESRR